VKGVFAEFPVVYSAAAHPVRRPESEKETVRAEIWTQAYFFLNLIGNCGLRITTENVAQQRKKI